MQMVQFELLDGEYRSRKKSQIREISFVTDNTSKISFENKKNHPLTVTGNVTELTKLVNES